MTGLFNQILKVIKKVPYEVLGLLVENVLLFKLDYKKHNLNSNLVSILFIRKIIFNKIWD